MRSPFGSLVASVALGGAIPSAASAEPLQPTRPWVVDYDDAQCVAVRQYGTDDKPLLLMFKPSPRGSSMRLLVATNGSADAQQVRASLRFGSAAPRKVDVLLFGDRKTKLRSLAMSIPMTEFRRDVEANEIAVSGPSISADFALSQASGVVAELDKCVADLKSYWRVDMPTEPAAMDAEPLRQLDSYFSPEDYPDQAIRHSDEGTVRMTILVDEAGGVRDCSIEGSSGIPTLDTMSCYIIQQRAKFKPATGPDGKPRRSAYSRSVTWRIAN